MHCLAMHCLVPTRSRSVAAVKSALYRYSYHVAAEGASTVQTLCRVDTGGAIFSGYCMVNPALVLRRGRTVCQRA